MSKPQMRPNTYSSIICSGPQRTKPLAIVAAKKATSAICMDMIGLVLAVNKEPHLAPMVLKKCDHKDDAIIGAGVL
jgi:hypothetical protein